MSSIPPSVARMATKVALTASAVGMTAAVGVGMHGRLTGGPRDVGPAISLTGASFGLAAVGLMAAQHVSPAWSRVVHGNLSGAVLGVVALGTVMLGQTIHGKEQRS
jgi:hypothetical protein